MNPHWTTQLRVYHLVCLWLLVVRTLVPVVLSENPTLMCESSTLPSWVNCVVCLWLLVRTLPMWTRTMKLRRSIILEQDKAYNESLQADRKLTKIAFFSVYMYIYFMVVCPIDNTCMWCNTCIRKKEEDEKIHN